MQVSLPATYLVRRLNTMDRDETSSEALAVLDTMYDMAQVALTALGQDGRVQVTALALEMLMTYTDDVQCSGAIRYA